jgi:hypothetical protein
MQKPLSREKVMRLLEHFSNCRLQCINHENKFIEDAITFEINHGNLDADEPARETIQALVGCKKCGVLFPGTISFGNAYCPSHRDEKKEDSNVEDGKPTIDVDCVIDEIEKEKQFSESQKYEEFHRGRGAGLNSAIAIIKSKLKKEPEVEKETSGDWFTQSVNGDNAICSKCGARGMLAVVDHDCKQKNLIDADELINKLNEMLEVKPVSEVEYGYDLATSEILNFIKSKLPKPKEEELKPCECGKSAAIIQSYAPGYSSMQWNVECSSGYVSCKASTAYYKTEAEAKAAWNKRAGEQA